jgi:hypothetical protein
LEGKKAFKLKKGLFKNGLSSKWEKKRIRATSLRGYKVSCHENMEFEENTHRVGENICQLHLRQRTDNQNI